MVKLSKEKLEEQVDSVYRLVLIVAQRAKQLGKGSKPLVRTESKKPSTVALEEMLAGKLGYEDDSAKHDKG